MRISLSANAWTRSSLVTLPLSAAVWARMSRMLISSSSGILILLLLIHPLVTAMAFGAHKLSQVQ